VQGIVRLFEKLSSMEKVDSLKLFITFCYCCCSVTILLKEFVFLKFQFLFSMLEAFGISHLLMPAALRLLDKHYFFVLIFLFFPFAIHS
jgi:hypothetical protein